MILNKERMTRRIVAFVMMLNVSAVAVAMDNKGIAFGSLSPHRFTLAENGIPDDILFDANDNVGVKIAVGNLQSDFEKVTGRRPSLLQSAAGKRVIIVGSPDSKYIQSLMRSGKLNKKLLAGKREKYVMTFVSHPFKNIDEALVIAGSDRRGAIYGIYELSEQIGVSPWYDWADVPVLPRKNLSVARGIYTAGEPAVRYRGIFLNDEAPCLTSWVKNTYGTGYGDHRFYARVFELLLRLRANFMWPAMWGWSFYADDSLNSKTAADMGIIMGTSHHEPMARNHQEWVRHRKEYGAWDYASNKKVLDDFFRKGIERSADNEDLITIGMRGDGDTALGGKEGEDDKYVSRDEYNLRLMRDIIKNQRRIIGEATGKAPEKRPQVWALYKEVQHLYDLGLRVPDDVTILLSDDNWGNVRRLPDAAERKHPGGWGMYYHVDYVGAPRNSKWLNVTPVQNLWEQMQLTYDYGVDRLWVLNVGDLKPMEYPISLFLDMAWNPKRYTAATLLEHTRDFCAQQFGEAQADEAHDILNLYSKYNGRVTPEMMDCNTYNLETGEWKNVADDYQRLEVRAMRQYMAIDSACRDAYRELILFPVQAMSNLYDMYYAQAMNHKLYRENNPEADEWACKVEKAFRRDSVICAEYNKDIAGGKWNGMMTQKHIGYKAWNDDFDKDTLPEVFRIGKTAAVGGYSYTGTDGYVAMEAEHYYSAVDAAAAKWTHIPYIGRTLGGMALMPYTAKTAGAGMVYRMSLPAGVDSVTVHVIVKSTLDFRNAGGHRYSVSVDGAKAAVINFNHDLDDNSEHVYDVFYPTVSRRVVEKQIRVPVSAIGSGWHTLTLSPLDSGIVFEKIVVDYGGYVPCYLFGKESHCSRL